MKSSPETDKIALAFVAAQAALTNPHTDSKAQVPTKSGGSFSYKYLSLPALLEHVKPELHANGMGLMQDTGPDGVVTRITHTSGQWYEFGPLRLPAGQDAQSHGSAITYARRYALAAALGLAADEDDDGSAASNPPRSRPAGSEKATTGSSSPPAGRNAGASEPATTSTGGEPDGVSGEGASRASGTTPVPSGGSIRPSECPHLDWEPAARKGFEICSRCGSARKAA